MKYLSALLVVFITVVFVGSAMAVSSGKTVEYAGGGNGKVIFSGRSHATGKCSDCHNKIFPMGHHEGLFKMSEMREGKWCGSCHNGRKAFSASDKAYCSSCHRK